VVALLERLNQVAAATTPGAATAVRVRFTPFWTVQSHWLCSARANLFVYTLMAVGARCHDSSRVEEHVPIDPLPDELWLLILEWNRRLDYEC
jgi:hypothetical protein